MNKLFISYCHKDEIIVKKLIDHFSPLKSNSIISDWYDRRIETGQEFQKEIDNNLINADIICLCISSSFLSSKACLDEKDVALKLKAEKGIRVIPIILSPCDWETHSEISKLLACPTDGRPITKHENQDDGFLDVVNQIKVVSKSINSLKKLELTDFISEFLNSTEILTKSHSDKERLLMDDIFVYPKLKSYDEEEKSYKYDSSNFESELLTFNKIIIAGENQSGKTTLCKALFKIYRQNNFVPIYLSDENKFLGNPETKIEKAYNEQYKNTNFVDIDKTRIVPIIDNFHTTKHQEKYIQALEKYEKTILIVDDIYGLNFRNQHTIVDYRKFKIRELSATDRNELITKWIKIKEETKISANPNHLQQSIDEKTEAIDASIGMIFGKGIMPAYPFFILSILAAYDTQKPLDSDITSQGHCYQALIYLYLRKEGVNNEQIDIYTNFLTELSYWLFKEKTTSIDQLEFDKFLKYYTGKFNMPVPIQVLLSTLSKVNICKYNSVNCFEFCYSYIYYFFVAKFLSENIDEHKNEINLIVANLHKDENAYITVFMSHHSKSNYLLDELLLNAEILYENQKPATLSKTELAFFDNHEDKIIKAVLPSITHNVTEERKQLLENKTKHEEIIENEKVDLQEDDEPDEFVKNIRLSIKTVEVMGFVLKNRSGSLNKERLQYIFEQGLNVHLRILGSFIDLIKDEKIENELVEFLTERIKSVVADNEEKDIKFDINKIEKSIRHLYWNLNFGVLHGFITKAVHSLGSINLLDISQAVDDKQNNPASFIVNQGIKMWYAKTLKVEEIVKRMKNEDFSKTANNLTKIKVVEHCRLHRIEFKELKKIEEYLFIPTNKLLEERAQANK